MSEIQKFEIRIHGISWAARGIHAYELRPVSGSSLPAFTAGSHIDLYLRNGLVRSYSLVNPQGETHRYVIAVNKDANTRGGSSHVHDALRVGDLLTIGAPRNNFELAESAPHSVLIAGGIGVTPLYCMMQRLTEIRASWQLYYSARTREVMPFQDEIRALSERSGAKALLNFDHEPGSKMLDLAAIVREAPAGAHLYCCGPIPMLEAFEKACVGIPPERRHVEYFSAKEAPATTGGFTAVLQRSNKRVFVPEGKTLLDALRDAGINVPFSCTEGVCGTCETSVISGTPDHRDLILTESERAAGKTMMVCVSGSKSAELVLDL
jgi:ferredoxin-NADP reductase